MKTARFRISPLALAAALTVICGCATTPKGSTSYYLPKAETQFVITQTLSCNAKGDTLHQVITVTPQTAYSSDLDVTPAVFTPSALNGTFTDTDVSLAFTDDGRLSGVNVTSTGQGGTLVKDVISIAKAAGLVAAAAPGALNSPKAACNTIKDYGAKPAAPKPAPGKAPAPAPTTDDSTPTVTLTYVGIYEFGRMPGAAPADQVVLGVKSESDNPPTLAQSQLIRPDASSVGLYNELLKAIPKLGFGVLIETASKKFTAARWTGASDSDTRLKLNSVANAHLTVQGLVGDLQGSPQIVWQGDVPVPLTTAADLYDLPIPKAKVFGSAKFVLALSSYGSIDKLGYATTGTSDAADAANSLGSAIAGNFKKPTKAEQASEVQSQADLIYQQQRLVLCQADPSKCPSK